MPEVLLHIIKRGREGVLVGHAVEIHGTAEEMAGAVRHIKLKRRGGVAANGIKNAIHTSFGIFETLLRNTAGERSVFIHKLLRVFRELRKMAVDGLIRAVDARTELGIDDIKP